MGTALFREFVSSIILFYFISALLFLGALYYLVVSLEIHNPLLLLSILTPFIIFVGYSIAMLALGPLKEHYGELENLSKETLHELNLPINTIMTNTKMLKKNEKDEKSLKRLGRIDSAVEMLQERYNELDYLIKKQMRYEIVEVFNLEELIHARCHFLTSVYSHAKIELDLESFSVKLDKIGLQKVIDNLIDNAVKYSPYESALIKVSLHNKTLRIQDFGRGLDEVEIFSMYDRYYQSQSNDKGAGIGLGLVRTYCDRYNINLTVESKKDVGTTMICDFSKVGIKT